MCMSDGQELPLLVDLVGFSGSGLSHTNWAGFRENLPERLNRLIGEQRIATSRGRVLLGGNQYINSASTGAWEDYLLREMLPTIERRYGCGGPGHRSVFGKSLSPTRKSINQRRSAHSTAPWTLG